MSGKFVIQSGVPLPPIARGRKKGSRARNVEKRNAVIAEGVSLCRKASTFTAAAKAIQGKYPRPNTSIPHLARLISEAYKG